MINKIQLEEIIEEKILKISPIAGGCIGIVNCIYSSNNIYVLKQYPNICSNIISCEVRGLNKIAVSDSLKIPKVIYSCDEFLLMEYIKQGNTSSNFWRNFGYSLANMHKNISNYYGLDYDNFLGSNLQKNTPKLLCDKREWYEFFFEYRLMDQLRLAEKNNFSTKEMVQAFSKLERIIHKILSINEKCTSLLHGDLWSGNFIVGEGSLAYVIDPAVYYGHREVDLAMTKLFGGFSPTFYDAYNEIYPLEMNWQNRESIYQLYYYMSHLNLMGISYYDKSMEILNSYL